MVSRRTSLARVLVALAVGWRERRSVLADSATSAVETPATTAPALQPAR